MKARRSALAAVLAVLLPLVSAADCKRGESPAAPAPAAKPAHDNRPTCPDIEFRAADERCFTIQTFVESRVGPYDVYINIVGGNGAYPGHIPVAAGGWKHAIVYRTGVKMTITVTLEVERPGSSDAYCSITDGAQLAKDTLKSGKAHGGAPYIAVCTLTTNQ